jgi:hypothetical protein
MEFYEKYKTYSNSELLKIIEIPNDYQSQAVETAKTIFSDRQLSEDEIKVAKVVDILLVKEKRDIKI